MSNPVAALIEWLKKQDSDIQTDIAFIMSGINPSFDLYSLPIDTEEMHEYFYARIDEFSGTEIQNAGFIVAFRAIFDFAFAKKRGTKKGWDEPKKLFESIIESNDPDQPSGMKDTARASLKSLPEKRDKWIEVCREWEVLKKSALSDQAIDAWESSNMISRH